MKVEDASKKIKLQEASRMASRGPQSTLFHLLFPILMILSFTLFYLVPLVVARYLEPSGLAELVSLYLKWSALVVVAATLISYHKARQLMLRPYLRQVDERAPERCKES